MCLSSRCAGGRLSEKFSNEFNTKISSVWVAYRHTAWLRPCLKVLASRCSSISNSRSSNSSSRSDGNSNSSNSCCSSRLILPCHQSVTVHYVRFKRAPTCCQQSTVNLFALLFVNHKFGCLYCFSNIGVYTINTSDTIFCSSTSKASVAFKL